MIGRRSLLTTLGAMLGVLTGRLEARAGMLVPASPFDAAQRRNALLRPVALRPRGTPVPVTPFGATGNGTVDDTAAINAALAAAGASVNGAYGATCQLSKGVYLISGALNVPDGVWFQGSPGNSSIILLASTFNAAAAVTNADHSGGQEYFYVSGIQIDGNAGAACSYGIQVSSVYVNTFIEDCIITGIPGVGLYFDNPANNGGPYFVKNNWVLHSAGDNIEVNVPPGGSLVGLNFYGNSTEHCGAGYANFHFTTGQSGGLESISIFGHHFEQASGNGSNTQLLCDGAGTIVGMIGDGLLLETGQPTAFSSSAGVRLANVFRSHFRCIENPNSINPVLIDTNNGVTITGPNVPLYSTPDSAYATGQLNPAKDNAYTLGGSGIRWSAVWAANGTIQTSDGRVKKDIVRLDYGLDELLRLAPVSFNWKDGKDGRQCGLVAQTVQDVIPEAVVRGEDPEGLLGLKYSALIPVIINAIAALKQENDALKIAIPGRA